MTKTKYNLQSLRNLTTYFSNLFQINQWQINLLLRFMIDLMTNEEKHINYSILIGESKWTICPHGEFTLDIS